MFAHHVLPPAPPIPFLANAAALTLRRLGAAPPGVEVRPQLLTRNAGDALDLKQPLGGHPLPLGDGGPGQSQFARHHGLQTPPGSQEGDTSRHNDLNLLHRNFLL